MVKTGKQVDHWMFNNGNPNCYREIPLIMFDIETGEIIEYGMKIVEDIVQTITGGNIVALPFLTYAL